MARGIACPEGQAWKPQIILWRHDPGNSCFGEIYLRNYVVMSGNDVD